MPFSKIHSIRSRSLTLLSLFGLITIGLIISYTNLTYHQQALQEAEVTISHQANIQALRVAGFLNSTLEAANTLARVFENYEQIPLERRKDFFKKVLEKKLSESPNYTAVWAAIDNTPFTTSKSRKTYNNSIDFQPSYYRKSGVIKLSDNQENNNEILIQDFFTIPKRTKSPVIIDPWYHSYTNVKRERNYICRISVPVSQANNFIGVVGIDISISPLSELMTEVSPYENSEFSLISNNGTYVISADEKNLNKKLYNIHADYNEKYSISSRISSGKPIVFTDRFNNDELDYIVCFHPIQIDQVRTPWSICLTVPQKSTLKKVKRNLWISILIGVVCLIFMMIIYGIVMEGYTSPMKQITNVIKTVSGGDLSQVQNEKISTNTTQEIFDISSSLQNLVEGLKRTIKFANAIGHGKLETKYKPLGDNDELGNALLEMRTSLITAKQQEQERIKENAERNWATIGYAQFSDILRQTSNKDIADISYEIIYNIVKYLNATQAAIFLSEQKNEGEEPVLEMAASVAYDKRKYATQQFQFGEGLIGTCAIEKETIFMKKIPEDYIAVTSGMGSSTPRNLLLVPLLLNSETLGVLEIASFKPFEKNEIEFIEQLAENISSTISSVKITEQTNSLLVQYEKKTAEMAEKDRIMQENLDKLDEIQLEAQTKEFHHEVLKNAVNSSLFVFQYDLNRKIIDVNEEAAKLFKAKRADMIGMPHLEGLEFEGGTLETYTDLWNSLLSGHQRRIISKFQFNELEFWFMDNYIPINNPNGEIIKILRLSYDYTPMMETRAEKAKLETQLEKLKLEYSIIEQKRDELLKRVSEIQNDFNIQKQNLTTEYQKIEDKLKEQLKQTLSEIEIKNKELKFYKDNQQGKE